MCQKCPNCGSELVGFPLLSEELQKKLNPENRQDAYEYCCLCPNGCPDQRPPPDNQDKCEMCCDCG